MTDSRPRENADATAPAPRRIADPVMIVALVLCAVAVLAINNRIFTFVSGFDPMIYIRIARNMIVDGIVPSSLVDGSGMTAPGFPLILAVAIRLFGPAAPYWINPVIALALLPLLAVVLMRVGIPTRQAAVALPSALLLLISGYSLNAHFLLSPFRELPAFGMSVVGMWMLFAAADRESACRRALALAAGAGACTLATACIREPTALGMAGAVAWYAASRRSWRTKGAVLSCFLAPFVLAGLAYLAVSRGHAPNAQWTKWIDEVSHLGVATMFDRFMAIEPMVRLWFFQEMGWFWSAMLLAGIWSLRTNPRALAAFLLPAVLLHLFYSFTEGHRRYLLSSLLYVAPVAGCGLGWIAETVASRLPERKQWISALPHSLAIAGVAAFMIAGTLKLTPAGPRVKWPQVEKAVLTLSRATSQQGSHTGLNACASHDRVPILMTPCARYGKDLVSSFTYAKATDIAKISRSSLVHDSWLVLAGANAEAKFRGGYEAYHGISADAIAAHFANSEPACGWDQGASTFVLGHGLYTIFRTLPRVSTNAVCAVDLRPNSNNLHVVWLDFHHSDSPPDTTVSVCAADGSGETQVAVVRGEGFRSVILPSDTLPGPVLLRMAASGPIPTNVTATAQTGDDSAQFILTTHRSPSVHNWFKHPFRRTTFGDECAAVIDQNGGRIAIPMPAAQSDLNVDLTLGVAETHRSKTPSSFRLLHDSATIGTMDLTPGSGQRPFSFRIGGVKARQTLVIDIGSTTPESRSVWRIPSIDLRIQPVGDR
jgi:hypothetical protein